VTGPGSGVPPKKIRADQLVLERGLAESRAKAQARILAGEVVASGAGFSDKRVEKPGELLRSDVELRLKGDGLRYVSRGGLKLEAALDSFALDPAGRTALDLGASTGGFTDCLLQRGAVKVIAVDVGRGQLHQKLKVDPRVESHEQVNARELPASFGPVGALVADLSFISATLVLPAAVPLVSPGGWLVVLVKPQFEAGREWVEKGGVVRDEGARRASVTKVRACLESLGCEVLGDRPSPIEGPAGNVEFLVAAKRRVVG